MMTTDVESDFDIRFLFLKIVLKIKQRKGKEKMCVEISSNISMGFYAAI